MVSINRYKRRIQTAAAALGLLSAAVLPSLAGAGAVVYAAPSGGQVTTRSIKLSSSKTSDTGVSYNVKFNSASAFTVKGIIVDFCNTTGGSPIVGDSNCAAPTAPFTVGASPTVTLQQGLSATWTASSLNSGRTLKIVKHAGDALSVGTTVEFTITGVTNPGGTAGTFYGRVITYSSDVGDIASYAAGTEGSTDAIDYGGFALSTANQLNVTAKVQESLVFCVYTTGATCAGASGTAVPLGDVNGVLSNYATNYTNTANFNVASNAQGGVVVNLKGENLCRVAAPCTNADNGNIINRSGDTCTADTAATSTEQFGLRVSVPGSGVTADAAYACLANNHTFDRTSATSTYGDVLASTSGPGDEVQSTVELMAKAATTTEAGIYTTTLSMIATGTY
jgi:hypothetical protein